MSSAAQPPQETRRRRRSWLGVFLGLFVTAFIALALILAITVAAGDFGDAAAELANDQVAVIEVAGIIMSAGEPSMFGPALSGGALDTIELIREVARDDAVAAVVVRVDSPGGSAAASQEIYQAIIEARESKPFICSMADVAASGGYYIAAGCDEIVANPATMTGSIGVIMSSYDLSGLYDWLRIRSQTVKSGRYKDAGSMDRPMSPAEREMFQAMIMDVHGQFVNDIAQGRDMQLARVRRYADGRVMTGSQARRLGFVDHLGGFYDAVDIAREAAGLSLEDDPNLIWPGGGGTLFDQLLGMRGGRAPAAARPRLESTPALAPLWLLAPLGSSLEIPSLPGTGS